MREAVYESAELESDWEDCVTLSLERVGSLEAKWEDLEVASVCSSTTAGFGTASTASDFGWEFLEPITPSRPCAPKIDISSWQAALRRAELTAKEYAQQWGTGESQRRRRCKRAPVVEKTETQKLADELKNKYQVSLHYDLPSTGPATPFEKLRWKFLKDHANAFCASLSGLYLSCGRQWHLKPAPVARAVEDRGFVFRVHKRGARWTRGRQSGRKAYRFAKQRCFPSFTPLREAYKLVQRPPKMVVIH